MKLTSSSLCERKAVFTHDLDCVHVHMYACARVHLHVCVCEYDQTEIISRILITLLKLHYLLV